MSLKYGTDGFRGPAWPVRCCLSSGSAPCSGKVGDEGDAEGLGLKTQHRETLGRCRLITQQM